MKYILFLPIFLLTNYSFANERAEINEKRLKLEVKLDAKRKEMMKCPHIRRLTSVSNMTNDEKEYFHYAKNGFVGSLNKDIGKYKFDDFKARLNVRINKNGLVESIKILSLKPEDNVIDIDNFIKKYLIKLKSTPIIDECGKYEIHFSVTFSRPK